jgi:hypothetical protein
MTLADYAAEGDRLSKLLDAALSFVKDQIRKAAEAERVYRHAKARAWAEHPDGTAKEREALVDAATADLRYERDLAAGMVRASFEAVHSRQQQISLLQTMVKTERSELELARTGPEMTP